MLYTLQRGLFPAFLQSLEWMDHSGCDVCWADDALAGNALIGKRVVVVGGAATGIEVALWAARKGAMDPQMARFLAFYDALPKEEAITRTFRGDREVCLIEMLPKIGNSVGKSTRWVFLDKLAKLGVTVITNARITLLQNRICDLYSG